ncbi:hypothetical protein Q9Q94_12110 [Uliginosibacterium sp. 31-16]|uniref:hypothetical protein n=1 Tax=Uliginosibacterium sp. 31-16 TaxID=3068315 RepID=UPI00273E77DD|nr:hypothetical protein [Uliginosibacterium sp. 31-16]MDP5240277.1 hypothetical protein [Uliginosibacterium sp. 31-16]
MSKFLSAVMALACALSVLSSPAVHAAEATLAGFAFAGDFKTAPARFPYSFKVFEKLKAAGAGNNLSAQVISRSQGISNPALELRPASSLVNLKNSDQALMAVLVLTDEIVSSENYGSYYKTFVNLRGNLLIFDYKAQAVIRTYPLSTVIFDATPSAPSEARLQSFVETQLAGQDGQSLISLFTKRLATAELPKEGTKSLQVKKVEVSPEALAQFPAPLRKDPKAAATLMADAYASILSARTGVPLLPNSIGAVGGVMMMRLENGDDFKLKVAEGDYLFDLKLNGFVKKKTDETNVGIAYVYGVYSSLRFYEPSLGTEFINTDIKNGESSVVPATQVSADDFPAYSDAINGLYKKFTPFLIEGAQTDQKWLVAAASAKDIKSQVETARDILRKCK